MNLSNDQPDSAGKEELSPVEKAFAEYKHRSQEVVRKSVRDLDVLQRNFFRA